MDRAQYYKNLEVPSGRADVVLDTDTFNEIDDQFALAYLLAASEKLNVKALYAAPFFHNGNSESPADGMNKSYEEILRLLSLIRREEYVPLTFRGSEKYLSDEVTPVSSDAARHLVSLAENYSPEYPLYVTAIGALTNVASALLMKPEIAENIVIVWLGGHGREYHDTREFNMFQDVAAARVFVSERRAGRAASVYGSGKLVCGFAGGAGAFFGRAESFVRFSGGKGQGRYEAV